MDSESWYFNHIKGCLEMAGSNSLSTLGDVGILRRELRKSSKPHQASTDQIKGPNAGFGQPDEIHYTSVPGTHWNIALWRYLPKSPTDPTSSALPQVKRHSVVIVPGCASNARSFDLGPSVSLPRYLASQGYDTWVVEMRGVGEAVHGKTAPGLYLDKDAPAVKTIAGKSGVTFKDSFMSWKSWAGEKMIWDVDTYIKEDFPVALEYIVKKSAPSSGQVVGVGHSMGGMILYAYAGLNSGNTQAPEQMPASNPYPSASQPKPLLAGIVTLASSLSLGDEFSRCLEHVSNLDLSSSSSDFSSLTSPQDEITFRPDPPPPTSPLQSSQTTPSSTSSSLTSQPSDTLLSTSISTSSLVSSSRVAPSSASVDEGMRSDEAIYAKYARMGAYVPELTHVLPVPVDLVSQLQAAMVSPYGLWSQKKPPLSSVAPVNFFSTFTLRRGPSNPTVEEGGKVEDSVAVSVNPTPARAPPKTYLQRACIAGTRSTTSAVRGGMASPVLRRLLNLGFETVPLALLMQMTTLFDPEGLRARGGDLPYSSLLTQLSIPVLALAGGADPVVPPASVAATAQLIPNSTYFSVGAPACQLDSIYESQEITDEEEYFSHYDVIIGSRARTEVYPKIVHFLQKIETSKDEDLSR
eukprot:CAMPEP_0196590884 /NCGR_PEP_ID=MMETSP1081-20130531/67874_1 /TAXON_ID=36882 /ORGANISM="Pyramimonas amylifera, Strain CCMP720" /LENGTH=634 /DNA_ID=CAMNT_0041914107 /DNA_START=487 /DNA_END=2392 /DNA_ORIENTATION=-